jgi:NADH-quinone oxidoreductase subunit E
MDADVQPVAKLCQRHRVQGGSLVMLLQDIQGAYGYLPSEVLKAVSRQINVPLTMLYGLATFYRSFSLTPRGKHEVCVCTGTACHVRGAPTILQHLERRLGIARGQTTPDGLFSLVNVNCLGACALGPLVVVDGKYHGKVTVTKAEEVLLALKASEGEAKA